MIRDFSDIAAYDFTEGHGDDLTQNGHDFLGLGANDFSEIDGGLIHGAKLTLNEPLNLEAFGFTAAMFSGPALSFVRLFGPPQPWNVPPTTLLQIKWNPAVGEFWLVRGEVQLATVRAAHAVEHQVSAAYDNDSEELLFIVNRTIVARVPFGPLPHTTPSAIRVGGWSVVASETSPVRSLGVAGVFADEERL